MAVRHRWTGRVHRSTDISPTVRCCLRPEAATRLEGMNNHPHSHAISVRDLRKVYGDAARDGTAAVDGLDLDIRTGEVFALLGPNGAGKTTTIEILERFRSRTSGAVSVLGEDPGQPSASWRQRTD